MCGIAGVVSWADDGPLPIGAMVDALAHRGPDGRGEAEIGGPGRPRVAFGHTRLAILDLSARGAQPMSNEAGTIWITFNGEIFNFEELRRELEGAGCQFRSRTDTEVILRGYDIWGEDVVSRLRGMFAVGIWDGPRRTVILARDRFGIKPLYYHHDRAHVVFASEVRALLASGRVPRRLDRTALRMFLAYQSVAPPRTLVDGVRLLHPGTLLRIDAEGRVTERAYWDLLDAAAAQRAASSEADVTAETRRLLRESTALHLVSDVPVGVFLSGGIDSSALVALTRDAGVVPRTFSVVLPGMTGDESAHARAIAAHFGAVHEEIPLSADTFQRSLPDALSRVDHPSGDGMNTYAVAAAVRAAGLKVALSGVGGDEVFGGYPSFNRMRRLSRLRTVWRHTPARVRQLAAAGVRVAGRSSVASSKTAALLESDTSVPAAFPILRQLFDRADQDALIGDTAGVADDPYRRIIAEAVARHPSADITSLVSYAECRTYMHDVLLRDTDQMSMAHALEVRVPLLDHRLAEYVVGLPESFKIRASRAKPLLVDSLPGGLPAAVTGRPKQGFVLPFTTWMRHQLRPFCEHHLDSARLARRSGLRPEAVAAVWQRFLAADPSTSWSRPWTLVALSAWLDATRVEA